MRSPGLTNVRLRWEDTEVRALEISKGIVRRAEENARGVG